MTKLENIDIIPDATKEIILNQLTRRNDIKDYISSLTSSSYYKDELLQELFLQLCEMDETKLINIYKRDEINRYIAGILIQMLKPRSNFDKKIKRFQGLSHEEDNLEGFIEQVLDDLEYSTDTKHLFLEQLEIAINNLFYYNKNILKDYIKLNFSIKKVSEKNKIHPYDISHCLTETKKILKTEILKQIRLIEDNKY